MTSQPTDLQRALDPHDPDFATRSAAEEMLADELTAREGTKRRLLAELDALREQLAFAQERVHEATVAWNILQGEPGLTNEQLGIWLTRLTGEAPEIVDDPQDRFVDGSDEDFNPFYDAGGEDKAVR